MAQPGCWTNDIPTRPVASLQLFPTLPATFKGNHPCYNFCFVGVCWCLSAQEVKADMSHHRNMAPWVSWRTGAAGSGCNTLGCCLGRSPWVALQGGRPREAMVSINS